MTQGTLFTVQPTFDGSTFEPEVDADRLTRQLDIVQRYMLQESDHQWRSLREISQFTEMPEASISARLRDLRKPRFGGYLVERRRRSAGTFEYRVSHD
jgi:RIO-like serine/threonine protein kinase